MVAFGVIAFLVLILAYFVVRNQSLQKELSLTKHSLRSVDNQSKYTLNALVVLSGQLQNMYLSRLNSLQKHALISQADFDIANFILSNAEFVIMQCCEHRATVEEAVGKCLEKSDMDMEKINKFIARHPSEVRVPWCKNTVGGFVAACFNLTSDRAKRGTAETAAPPAQMAETQE